MYNGIGLPTPRGSGTNGYVQRNLSSLRVKRPRDDRGGERDEKDRERLESQLNRQPNAEILEHQRKRQLEVKCAELQDMMEEQGWDKVLHYNNLFTTVLNIILCFNDQVFSWGDWGEGKHLPYDATGEGGAVF